MKLIPGLGLAELISQHDRLRELMDQCEDLADAVENDPLGDPAPLMRTLTNLRLALDAHNKFEEQLLRLVLRQHDHLAPDRIERMVEDHLHEHRTMCQQLSSPATAVLRTAIETLRTQLDAEERDLLTPSLLRDELTRLESAG